MVANDTEGPFSIGQNIWPGIAKLIEECGDVTQVCGKLIATGGREDHYWSGHDLGCDLVNELGDLLAAIDFVRAHNVFSHFVVANGLPTHGAAIEARRREKFDLFQHWHGGHRYEVKEVWSS